MVRLYKKDCSNGTLLYDCMDLCLEHNGIGFEKTLYSDAGDDDIKLVLNAKYSLCGEGDDR